MHKVGAILCSTLLFYHIFLEMSTIFFDFFICLFVKVAVWEKENKIMLIFILQGEKR